MTVNNIRVQMKLSASMRIDKKIEDVFLFFSDAANLEKITPPELSFSIVSPLPIEIKKGAVIFYKMGLFGIRFKWISLISAWEPPFMFVDEQTKGPYKKWVHTHTFRAEGNETVIEDNVDYELPFYPLSILVLPVIKLQLKRIFSYRQKMVRQLL